MTVTQAIEQLRSFRDNAEEQRAQAEQTHDTHMQAMYQGQRDAWTSAIELLAEVASAPVMPSGRP